ncbi:Uu.00g013190.m01.CDS01 [Anthostomella pinea]|uniref:Uu.00g013190.m01.CDS01 n=1 Tax=Anthostomella pinea TaxID=933095 RepID=A0AAI8VZ03_9PEZI|nr:Uu.00g013190.m01.CDS01 [Anthostomella pinea]
MDGLRNVLRDVIRRHAQQLVTRQDANNPADELLELLQNPFRQQLGDGAIWSALGTSIGFTAFIAIAFSLVRPYNTVVYAPKLKHADEKHAPPPIGKGYLAWFTPLWKTTEKDLIAHAGMDAAVFLRFTRMCRNIFLVITVIGCGILIPIYYGMNSDKSGKQQWFMRLTPQNVFAQPVWALVVVGYLFNLTICGFLWWNYRRVLQLRRMYFESEDYQRSLSARTLMLNDIPKKMASDEGIARMIDKVIPQSSFSRTVIARNVKDIPDLIQQHDHTVRKLEKVLAKYLKDPDNLPASRPMCYPSKKDPSYSTYPKGQKIDAIEYLTQRIRELEIDVKEARNSLDKRNTLSYGFASYDDISEAHSIAHALRSKKAQGARVVLAPKPNDIIWDNMPMTPATRSWRRLVINFWISILTLLWIAPNAMIAIFLVNLSNLGLVWPAFQTQLAGNSGFWSIVQGVASPAITSLVYLVLPIIFRRLSIRAGDRTKTGRERHVVAKLYAFFVFNNLIVFSLFSTIWSFIASVVNDTQKGLDAWQAIGKNEFGTLLFVALCNISPFWVTWLLQRNLGAAIDLAQLWTLIYSFCTRKFSSPTPREMIELTAPPSFDYASYYNYFLYYSTVALCYGGLQPLVLPAAALYFSIDVWLKKYLLLYIFVTKTESGGQFWRVLFNRFVFGTIISNLVIFLAVFVRGDGTHTMAYAVAPLPFIMIFFKIYCARTFDVKIHYYSTGNVNKQPETSMLKDPLRSSNLASRFGHPALYKGLITPMVHAKAQNILASIYKGRLTDGREVYSGDAMSTSGYSDSYVMNPMNAGKPGKSAALPGFEIVPESRLDFEYYKNRQEFASEHGGGDIYGRSNDVMRPGTPGSSMWNGSEPPSRSGSPTLPSIPRVGSPVPGRIYSPTTNAGITYPSGYSQPISKPYAPSVDTGRSRSPIYAQGNDSASNLVSNAAAMPMTTPGPRERSLDRVHRSPGGAGMLGGGPQGYGGLPQDEDMGGDHDPMSYNYFREARTPKRHNPDEW